MSKWMDALHGQKIEARSARDASTVTGYLDTGNYALNWAIAGRFLRGYPLGHSIEIFGDPSTGKSYLAARAIAMAQQAGGVVLVDDTEAAYSAEWIEALGVDVDELAIECSRTVGDHLGVAQGFLEAYKEVSGAKKGAVEGPGLLVCDSLALLSTAHELEVGMDKKDMTKAGELKAFFRIIGGDLHECNAVYICTNHVIANIGNMWDKRTTSGGGGPKYQSSVRLDLQGASKLKSNDGEGSDYTGVRVRIVVEKNRLSPPWKKIQLSIPFYQPISPASGLIPVLVDLGILEMVGGGALRYHDEPTGLHAFKDKKKILRQDEEAEALLDQVPELLEEADDYLERERNGTMVVEEEEETDA